MKETAQQAIALCAYRQLRGVKIANPVRLLYHWFEPNKKRDKDNIAAAQKFVQDALVACGVLANDGWANITGFTHDFAVDAKKPRVEIEIIEEGTAA
jgi:Holliday junction resolvase RusA-like endonuclease